MKIMGIRWTHIVQKIKAGFERMRMDQSIKAYEIPCLTVLYEHALNRSSLR